MTLNLFVGKATKTKRNNMAAKVDMGLQLQVENGMHCSVELNKAQYALQK